MVRPSSIKNRVGILGGGQLALMLANSAGKLGLRPLILAENASGPAAKFHKDSLIGSIHDKAILKSFLSQVQFVSFENEFVDCQVLQEALEEVQAMVQTNFYPRLNVIATLQDKLKQKKMMQELGLPTSPYVLLHQGRDWQVQLQELLQEWQGSCVLKWSRLGYDGKGVLVVEAAHLPQDRVRIERFLQEAYAKGSEVFAERKINFRRELAMMSVRSLHGEFLSYPLVISQQQKGICFRVYGPATAFGVSSAIEKRVQEFAFKIAEQMQFVGTFAIELFETDDSEVFINEIAPRVHNSGHYTQNACGTDQFENHWRAVLGLPLGAVQARPGHAMVNLLGPEYLTPADSTQFNLAAILPRPSLRVHLHWYSKDEVLSLRKMGHLNGTVDSDSVEDIEELLGELEECRLQWVESLAKRMNEKEG